MKARKPIVQPVPWLCCLSGRLRIEPGTLELEVQLPTIQPPGLQRFEYRGSNLSLRDQRLNGESSLGVVFCNVHLVSFVRPTIISLHQGRIKGREAEAPGAPTGKSQPLLLASKSGLQKSM